MPFGGLEMKRQLRALLLILLSTGTWKSCRDAARASRTRRGRILHQRLRQRSMMPWIDMRATVGYGSFSVSRILSPFPFHIYIHQPRTCLAPIRS